MESLYCHGIQGGGTTEPEKWMLIKTSLTIGVVSYTMKRTGWSENDTLRRFLDSEVYECLQDEETKTWYFSAYQLSEFFENELEGRRIWPDM